MTRGDSGPFEIALTLTKGPGVRLVFRNTSSVSQEVLVQALLQPVELTLRDSSGKMVAASDSRNTAKYDRTAYCEYFETLPPGDSLEPEEAVFESDADVYSFSLEPFSFDNLLPGSYTVQARWTSALSTCIDRDSGATTSRKDVWMGTVTSNELQITLK